MALKNVGADAPSTTEPTPIGSRKPTKMERDVEAQIAADAAKDGGDVPASETVMVSGYDANNEPADVPARRTRAPKAATPDTPQKTQTGQIIMPKFGGLLMDELPLNIGGRLAINYADPMHRRFYDELRPGNRFDIVVEVQAMASGGWKVKVDNTEDRNIKQGGKSSPSRLEIIGFRLPDDEAPKRGGYDSAEDHDANIKAFADRLLGTVAGTGTFDSSARISLYDQLERAFPGIQFRPLGGFDSALDQALADAGEDE